MSRSVVAGTGVNSRRISHGLRLRTRNSPAKRLIGGPQRCLPNPHLFPIGHAERLFSSATLRANICSHMTSTVSRRGWDGRPTLRVTHSQVVRRLLCFACGREPGARRECCLSSGASVSAAPARTLAQPAKRQRSEWWPVLRGAGHHPDCCYRSIGLVAEPYPPFLRVAAGAFGRHLDLDVVTSRRRTRFGAIRAMVFGR
jgi:hypothetical protein